MTNVQHDGIAVFSSIRLFSYKGNLKSLLNHNTLGIKIAIKINIVTEQLNSNSPITFSNIELSFWPFLPSEALYND